jgi:hypothetical protein
LDGAFVATGAIGAVVEIGVITIVGGARIGAVVVIGIGAVVKLVDMGNIGTDVDIGGTTGALVTTITGAGGVNIGALVRTKSGADDIGVGVGDDLSLLFIFPFLVGAIVDIGKFVVTNVGVDIIGAAGETIIGVVVAGICIDGDRFLLRLPFPFFDGAFVGIDVTGFCVAIGKMGAGVKIGGASGIPVVIGAAVNGIGIVAIGTAVTGATDIGATVIGELDGGGVGIGAVVSGAQVESFIPFRDLHLLSYIPPFTFPT